MNEYLGDYVLKNNDLQNNKSVDFDWLKSQPSVYEVIRLINGIPLFIEKHVERMRKSALLINLSLKPDAASFEVNIRKLANANNIKEGNLKIVFPLSPENTCGDVFYYFIPHQYPTASMYAEGVLVSALKAERSNPNAKISGMTVRALADQMIASRKVYEVLLVNDRGMVTEGSRSNFFFVKDNELFTSPENTVLQGITRNMVISLCKDNNIPIHEREIPLSDLHSFSATFITGTSPKILPVKAVDDLGFTPSNPLILKIMKLYDELINNYLNDKSRL
ncbi:MAG: aminotransferase class IV [Sphingobacteriia bacterium]|nr:aminotransferase class IV [Sphingobacteriia bacterium]